MTNSNVERAIADTGYAKVLVKLRKRPTMIEMMAAQGDDSNEITRLFEPTPLTVDQPLRLGLATSINEEHATYVASFRSKASPSRGKIFPRLGLALGYVDKRGLAALKANGEIEAVHEAPEMTLIRPVSSEAATAQKEAAWGILKLKADELWRQGYEGEGVIIGHLDTGVDGSHPALDGAIRAFAQFDLDGNEVPGAQPSDSGDHGTHTAGTLVGRSTNISGPIGVAPKAKLASAMVIEGGDVVLRILAGLEWLVEQNVRIVSLSLGLPGYTDAFQDVIDALRDNNVLPVIAVGNDGPGTSRSPGNYANVLSIGAMADDETVASFSGSESFSRATEPLVPTLVAPGVGVYSCVPGGQFKRQNGSSMATPHIAGLAALLLNAVPEASIADLETSIAESCSLPGTMSQDRANRGFPDAVKALAVLRSRVGAEQPSAAE